MAVPQNVASSPASLYVGDLHTEVTDGQLFDVFFPVGNLVSVRVCRDSSSGRSLGYGYVNFGTADDANRAIETMNHSPLNGKAIRVMWSRRDPNARGSGIGNLFVKNMSDSIDNVKFRDMFSKFGNILSSKVEMSPDGKSKGYGFVQFESEESANAAISELHGCTVDGKQLYVSNHQKKSERLMTTPDAKYTNLYMKNIDPDITEEVLLGKFSEFGKICNLVISKDGNGTSQGFGFVNFDSPDDAKRAMEAMNGKQLGSKVLYVARAQKKAEREQLLQNQYDERRNEQIQKYKGLNVYVKNINDDVTVEELREHFGQCGIITSLKLVQDEKGISKGFGFVCFSTPEEASRAVHTLHGSMFHRKPLYVALAQRKEERRAMLQLQYAQHNAGFSGPSPAVIQAGYQPLYYSPPGVIPQIPSQPRLMYETYGMRPGWRGNGYASSVRPAFQPNSVPMNPNGSRQHRQNRGRMNGHMPPQGGGNSVQSMPLGQHPGSQGVGNQQPELAAKITGMLLEMDNSELLLLLESPESMAAKVHEALQVLKLSQSKAADQESLHPRYLAAEVIVS
ncbi:Polyadenylate-binding protein/Hyperplastic disc protein [Dillenia turbinata]|uniref:Polyadenylate-binding protein n=1 Tax=Dillenia turbinata TaxID=194707 RepID=A0AAN8VH46_9MAGN